MEILQECRCVFYKKWVIIDKNTKKKNSVSFGEDSDEDENVDEYRREDEGQDEGDTEDKRRGRKRGRG